MAARRVEPGSTLARQRPNEENMSRSSVELIELLGLESQGGLAMGGQAARVGGKLGAARGNKTIKTRGLLCVVLWLVGHDVWREF